MPEAYPPVSRSTYRIPLALADSLFGDLEGLVAGCAGNGGAMSLWVRKDRAVVTLDAARAGGDFTRLSDLGRYRVSLQGPCARDGSDSASLTEYATIRRDLGTLVVTALPVELPRADARTALIPLLERYAASR